MKKLFVVLFGFSILFGALSGDALAQSAGSCTGSASGFYAPLPPYVFNCISAPIFVFTGDICFFDYNCPPWAGPIEAKSDCPFCTKPISLATGNTYIEQSDLRIPGLSNGLVLSRRWNSQWPSTQMSSQVGLFGPNWRSTYEERVFVGSDNYIKYARSDGSFWSFGLSRTSGSLVPAAPANVSATLVQGSSYWTLTFQNGEQRRFDINSGSLTAIIDRNGNVTQLTYDGLNRLVTVTDPVSRHLTFTYANSSSFLVTGVSSDVGLSLTYAYDSQNRLSQVTKPDLTTLTFQYDSNSMITAVLDSNGKVLESHTYDSSGRGLTGSRANGVEAVTITYANH
jgi:YD repeat-containing protein